jgi:hypothetical protein
MLAASAPLAAVNGRTLKSAPSLRKRALIMRDIMLGLSIVAGLALGSREPAQAHEWYPQECCHRGDCAPVDEVNRLTSKDNDAPRLVVTSKHGTAVFPATLPWRKSEDHRMHVCMRPSLYGGMGVVCIFVPPPMY